MSTHWPQVILFGDSHFQRGFSTDSTIASLISDRLQRRCDVLVRGFSGYNSRLLKLALQTLVNDLEKEKIAAVVVFVGSNDACEATGPQHVSLTEYSNNLGEIIGLFKMCGVSSDKIVLISPPPADQAAWEKSCLALSRPVTVRHNEALEKYAMACAMAAQKCGTRFVDLNGTMISSPDWKEYFADGLHLNPKGSQVLDRCLWSVLEPMVQHCSNTLPDWKDVDPSHPEKAFPQSPST